MNDKPGSTQPGDFESLRREALDAAWQVWYQDLFDREAPLQVEVQGRGLVQGLVELWARVLFETVRPGGGEGFSRFHLWWDRQHVKVEGPWTGANRLRGWVFGDQRHTTQGPVAAGDRHLLEALAQAHARLLLGGRSADEILAAAATAPGRLCFEAYLASLAA